MWQGGPEVRYRRSLLAAADPESKRRCKSPCNAAPASSSVVRSGRQVLALDEIEAVGVHHLGPRRHEVLHELLLRVGARVDFRERAQLRVRAEDQVDAGAGPLDLLGLAVAPF